MSKAEIYGSVWDAITDTPEQALRPESAGRTDAEDRGTPETARLDTGGSGEPPRRNAAPDQRSASRPGSRFSLDALVNIATALGCRVRVDLEAA